MSIEEAIEFLEKSIREGHRIIDEHSLLTDEHGYKEFEDGIKAREAILALLKTHPDNQPNEPLTLEELWEMDGQPVWATRNCVSEWCIVWIFEGRVLMRTLHYEISAFEFMEHGGEIYRRPPKEETA